MHTSGNFCLVQILVGTFACRLFVPQVFYGVGKGCLYGLKAYRQQGNARGKATVRANTDHPTEVR
jgi:hypothetical protein